MFPWRFSSGSRFGSPVLYWAGAFALCLLLGCQGRTGPEPKPSRPDPAAKARPGKNLPGKAPSARKQQEPLGSPPVVESDGQAEHWWFITQVQGHPVGYVHVSRTPVRKDGQSLVRWQAEHYLRLKRFGQQTVTRLQYWSLETPAGRVQEFGTQLHLGGAPQRCEARRQGDRFLLRLAQGNQELARSLPVPEDVRGFFALFQLRAEERTSREPVRIVQLHPIFLQTVPVVLRYQGEEPLQVARQTIQAHKLKAELQMQGQRLETLLWFDARGRVWKTETAGPGLVEVNLRSSQQEALAVLQRSPAWDLGRATSIAVQKPLPPVEKLALVRYRLRVPPGAKLSPPQLPPWQEVKTGAQAEVEIVVRSSELLRPGNTAGPSPQGSSAKPKPEYLQPSLLVDSDHPQVVALARSVAPDKQEPWQVAAALRREVHRRIGSKEFSLALASASEALRQGRGDCTEHAVLLAALARARGIPARLAYGLVHLAGSGRFAFHMWTELWLSGRWVPWDATQPTDIVGPDHVLLGHLSLRGPEDWTQLLPLVDLLGTLKLEVAEVVFRSSASPGPEQSPRGR